MYTNASLTTSSSISEDDDSSSELGERILTTKTQHELVHENEVLKRKIKRLQVMLEKQNTDHQEQNGGSTAVQTSDKRARVSFDDMERQPFIKEGPTPVDLEMARESDIENADPEATNEKTDEITTDEKGGNGIAGREEAERLDSLPGKEDPAVAKEQADCDEDGTATESSDLQFHLPNSI